MSLQGLQFFEYYMYHTNNFKGTCERFDGCLLINIISTNFVKILAFLSSYNNYSNNSECIVKTAANYNGCNNFENGHNKC